MKITIQAMKPEIVDKSGVNQLLVIRNVGRNTTVNVLLNHEKTSAPLWFTLRNARHPKAQVKRTAAQGTPRLVVYLNTNGACPFNAIEYRTRDQE